MLDTNLIYIVSLSKLDDSECFEYPTECTLTFFGKNDVHCRLQALQSGYRTKSFDCLFFEWMLYRGQARIKDAIDNRYNIWVGDYKGNHFDPTQYTLVSEEQFVDKIIKPLLEQSKLVKDNIRLLFNVPIANLDYYINMLRKHLVEYTHVTIFTYQEDNGIDRMSGWQKQNDNFVNICTKELYFA